MPAISRLETEIRVFTFSILRSDEFRFEITTAATLAARGDPDEAMDGSGQCSASP